MIVLFTDFGPFGPYQGELRRVIHGIAPDQPVIELLNNAPSFNPKASAYLLAALIGKFPPGAIFLCVVDPDVGGARMPVVIRADGHTFVGPDNGLFELVARRAKKVSFWQIDWRPDGMSATFHGRDLFAPVAARLSLGEPPPGVAFDPSFTRPKDWPDDLVEIIYIDHFGNCWTGLRAAKAGKQSKLRVWGHNLENAAKFSDLGEGEGFWFENSSGMVEIAVNKGRADTALGLRMGSAIELRSR